MEFETSGGRGNEMDHRVTRLFVAYREACPDPEVSSGFMPRLWEQIDAHRSSTVVLRKWAQAVVTAAAAICLLFGLLLTTARSFISPFHETTYVEVLAAEQSGDAYPDIELVSSDNGGYQRQ